MSIRYRLRYLAQGEWVTVGPLSLRNAIARRDALSARYRVEIEVI